MSNFVIVIEACNKRAHAAYTKGLNDLELIWPQIHDYSIRKDQLIAEEEKKEKATFDALLAKRRLESQEITRKMSGREDETFRYRPLTSPYELNHSESRTHDYYESLRAELKRMADISGAALGPYRMTETQVVQMIAWEDGSRVDVIKKVMDRGHIHGEL